MRASPLLVLLLGSLLVNVTLFLFSAERYEQEHPPGKELSYQRQSNQTIANQRASDTANFQINCDPNCAAKESNQNKGNESPYTRFVGKVVDDPLTAFTGLLALCTFFLTIYTGVVANATKHAADHIPIVERAYVSGGAGHPVIDDVIDMGRLVATINNYGKTPAFIGTVAVARCELSNLPDEPEWDKKEWKGYVVAPGTPSLVSDVSLVFIPDCAFIGRIW